VLSLFWFQGGRRQGGSRLWEGSGTGSGGVCSHAEEGGQMMQRSDARPAATRSVLHEVGDEPRL
jgi:hypothetical protein